MSSSSREPVSTAYLVNLGAMRRPNARNRTTNSPMLIMVMSRPSSLSSPVAEIPVMRVRMTTTARSSTISMPITIWLDRFPWAFRSSIPLVMTTVLLMAIIAPRKNESTSDQPNAKPRL